MSYPPAIIQPKKKLHQLGEELLSLADDEIKGQPQPDCCFPHLTQGARSNGPTLSGLHLSPANPYS